MKEQSKRVAKYSFLIVVLGAFIDSVLKVIKKPVMGWDHAIYCKASQVLDQGMDPYLTTNLGIKLSYTYPALFLPLYRHLCGVDFVFVGINIVLLAAMIWLLVRCLSSSLLMALPFLLIGYNSSYSNMETGNLGVIEAFLFVLTLVFTVRHKAWAVLFLAPMSFLKIVPSVMALPILWWENVQWSERFKRGAMFAAAILTLFLINFLYSPVLFFSFFKQITGGYSNQHSPVNELNSDASNPTVLLFFKNLSTMISDSYWGIPFVISVLCLSYISYWVWRNVILKEKNLLYKLCFSYLVLFLWLPRLKPYALISVCVVMIPLMSRLPKKFSIPILLLTVFHRVLNGTKTDPWWELISNNTAIYTMIAVLVLLSIRWKRDFLSSENSR